MIFCLAAGQAAAEAPFVPPGISPPDYEATITTTHSYPSKARTEIVMHHGDWTRVTTSKDSPGGVHYANNGVVAQFNDGAIDLRRSRLRLSGYDYEARNTGERQTHLGEGCTVWETQRRELNYGLMKSFDLSCVTDDGIELWQKSISGSSAIRTIEATKIERRPVSDDEVRPPLSLLALDWPERDTAASSMKPDHEIVMTPLYVSNGATPAIRTIRRSGPWQFKEDIDGPRRKIEITRDLGGARLRYESDETGSPYQLSIWQLKSPPPVPTSTAVPSEFAPKDLGRTETIIGETCHWFHMDPGWRDSRTEACRTEDGIVLKEIHDGRGIGEAWTTTRLTRHPVSIDEVKPPAELLQPHTWGLE